ncbi:ATP synthase subunit I [Thiorhodospira sibirica]|uniref:ATP synthase subunit I n=1 Tax=Thiorhodospira sibirica TaxID=154347 RepID=UPI00022C053C|nr:ATP synthase subunit I [Thiorhodospira sibirica]
MAMFNRATKVVLGLQLAIICAAFLLTSWLATPASAWSALVGGGIALLTTGFFAWRVFLGVESKSAKAVARSFYVAEVQKIALTVVLFLVAIVWLEVLFLPMFLTYIVSLMAFWLALLPALSGTNQSV